VKKIVVFTNLTLDGVMQAPGRPEEDRRGEFAHGGWATPYAAMMEADGILGDTGALLFGRHTYEDFYGFWPNQKDNPFTSILNNTPKFVASRTLRGPLPWMNSTLLEGEAAESVAKLKKEPGENLLMFGSGVLVQSLMRHGLVDNYVLLIHPLILGSGRRLFPDGGPSATLQLVDSKTTSSGVLIANYRPVDAAAPGARQVA
jgi:dihydrofolate reductase